MRISLNLLSYWHNINDFGLKDIYFPEHDIINNIYHTSTYKTQSLKDVLSDGALFHLLEKNGYEVYIFTNCSIECEEFSLLMSYNSDFNIKFLDSTYELFEIEYK